MSMLQRVARCIQCRSRDRDRIPSLKRLHKRKVRRNNVKSVREQLQ